MTKEQKIEKVKDLLNQVVVTAGKSTNEFLVSSATAAKDLLTPKVEEDDYYESDYYDSNC